MNEEIALFPVGVFSSLVFVFEKNFVYLNWYSFEVTERKLCDKFLTYRGKPRL